MGNNKPADVIKCRRCPVAYHLECLPRNILSTISKERGKRIWIARGKDADGVQTSFVTEA